MLSGAVWKSVWAWDSQAHSKGPIAEEHDNQVEHLLQESQGAHIVHRAGWGPAEVGEEPADGMIDPEGPAGDTVVLDPALLVDHTQHWLSRESQLGRWGQSMGPRKVRLGGEGSVPPSLALQRIPAWL